MLFTKESDYAIRVIRALQDGGKKTIKELCELEQIPSAFGYKILQKMNKSGLIEIRRRSEEHTTEHQTLDFI